MFYHGVTAQLGTKISWSTVPYIFNCQCIQVSTPFILTVHVKEYVRGCAEKLSYPLLSL